MTEGISSFAIGCMIGLTIIYTINNVLEWYLLRLRRQSIVKEDASRAKYLTSLLAFRDDFDALLKVDEANRVAWYERANETKREPWQ